jgi:hypothetical protein
MTAITVPEGVTFDAGQLMASMEDHTRAGVVRATDPHAVSISSMVEHSRGLFVAGRRVVLT